MRNKKKRIPKKSILLLSAAALLLLGSTIGSTRAALTYYSENYVAGMDLSSIGVSLLENTEIVSSRDYEDGEWIGNSKGTILEGFLGKNEKIVPGKKYPEILSVENSGNIDTYVRVIITKRWLDKKGDSVPATTLDPDLIELNILEENGWIVDENTEERTILYLNRVLTPEEDPVEFADYIRIKPEIRDKMTAEVTTTETGTTYTYKYDYDGYSFQIAAEVDAVQTHNAADAIKSAWGVDASKVGL